VLISDLPPSCCSWYTSGDHATLMWPFAKLRNGFGSHMYLYSPTSFDSQDLILFFFHTHFSSCHASAAPVLLLWYQSYVGHRWRMEMQRATSSASRCGGSSWYIYSASWSGFSNGEWRSVCHLHPELGRCTSSWLLLW